MAFFAVCLSTWHTAKVALFCRVPRTGHTAKGLCLPCAKPLRHMANTLFHGVFASALYFAVGPKMHNAKCLPCARDVAHGKLAHFAECKPAFTVCPWHTANRHSPAVIVDDRACFGTCFLSDIERAC